MTRVHTTPAERPRATTLGELQDRLGACMLRDQPRLRDRLRALTGAPFDPGAVAALGAEISASQARRTARVASTPTIAYPAELPVAASRERLAAAVAAHPVCIVCGETGSGKTTQIPKICLELGRGAGGAIGHTQPRRIAARSVAGRIASELGSPIGGVVGYKVRFTDEVSAETRIKVMTDGILLAEVRRDRDLLAYDTLIIDEAHERSLNIDFLLGYVKRLLPRRPDLKVIVTSATLDAEAIARHFDDAPVLEVEGRAYPVEVRYRPPEDETEGRGADETLAAALLEALHEASAPGAAGGDVLAFLAGEREIRDAAELIRGEPGLDFEVLPLYARLNAAQQERVFRPHARRRVILATNVAETSLTVPGIRYVVDGGRARVSRYSYRTRVQRLPVEPISQAAAEQRKGRCGRIGRGVCFRLYPEADLEAREPFTAPEIQRTNLASVILQMADIGLGRIDEFPFIDAPDERFVNDGFRLLRDLGALDRRDRITPLGRKLARLPVDPQIGRVILAGADHGCVAEILIVAAALSVGDPRDRPFEKRAAAREAHQSFTDPRSDFMTYLKIWEFYREHARVLSRSELRRLFREHFLSASRMREWAEVHRQLVVTAGEIGVRARGEAATYGRIHRALLAGLLSFVGARTDGREYAAQGGAGFLLSKGSGASARGARWIVAAELVETERLYAHTVARVRPEWIERAAGDLVRRTYFDVHWDRRREEVMAYERVALRGLTLIAKRRLRYEPVDPAGARAQLIWSGLVAGEYRTKAAFQAHNDALAESLRAIEHKIRRSGLLVDDATLFRFYDERIPAGITGVRAFEAWYARASRGDPRLLHLTAGEALRAADELDLASIDARFPDELAVGGVVLPLRYRFEPSGPADGVAVRIPLAILRQLDPAAIDWHVPGCRREKVVALLRALPKPLRRRLVPIPDVADRLLAALDDTSVPMLEALADALERELGVRLPPGAWRPDALAPHLRMIIELEDGGEVVASGRDFAALRFRHGLAAEGRFQSIAAAAFERRGIVSWSFGELPSARDVPNPTTVRLDSPGGVEVRGFPGLEDRRGSVALRLFDTPERAERASRSGLRRLVMLQLGRELKAVRASLPGTDALCLAYVLVPALAAGEHGADRCAELERDIVENAIDECFLSDPPVRWDEATFLARIAAGRPRLIALAGDLCGLLGEIFSAYRAVREVRRSLSAEDFDASLRDADEQLGRLVFRGFVSATPYRALREFPRYLGALRRRLEKLPGGHARDERLVRSIEPLWTEFWRYQLRAEDPDPGRDDFRWLLEELRVSAFAQELGARAPVSVRRCEDLWVERTGTMPPEAASSAAST